MTAEERWTIVSEGRFVPCQRCGSALAVDQDAEEAGIRALTCAHGHAERLGPAEELEEVPPGPTLLAPAKTPKFRCWRCQRRNPGHGPDACPKLAQSQATERRRRLPKVEGRAHVVEGHPEVAPVPQGQQNDDVLTFLEARLHHHETEARRIARALDAYQRGTVL